MSVTQGISEAMASAISQPGTSPSPSIHSSIASSTTTAKNPTDNLSLTHAINAASKQHHTQLNRAILARLPLALPPQNSDPAAYAIGLRHLLPIYHAFETAWAEYVSVEPKTPTMEDFSMEEAVMLSVLIHLNLPQLARADRLRDDVAVLLGVGHGELDSWMMKAAGEDDVLLAGLEESQTTSLEPAQRLDAASGLVVEEEENGDEVQEEDPEALDRSSLPAQDAIEHPALHSFIRHIQQITEEKPHVLIAYSWVLYMALFNGGRWIRAQLSKARTSWDLPLISSTQSVGEENEIGLSFWHFDGAQDGEDLKDEFKARMKDIEPMLTDDQRDDIVQESVVIFSSISRLVEELDEMVGTAVDSEQETFKSEADDEPKVEAGGDDDQAEEEQAMMVRSHMMRPRWETPLGYLELLFQILLPVGLWELLMLAVRLLQGTTIHPSVLRWNWGEGAGMGRDG